MEIANFSSIEMQNLCYWIKEHAEDYGWNFQIIWQNAFDAPQLVVLNKDTNVILWDAICHKYSYGGDKGLLEIMGTIVAKNHIDDTVEGYLTCNDVINRIHDTYGNKEE